MDTRRWQHIKETFQTALDLPPEERERFLTSHCGDDAGLHAKVASMLRSHDTCGKFLEPPSSPLHQSPTGKRVGAYRIVRQVGQGGMGEVFEAVRDDGEFRKRVALKVIRFGIGTEELIHRFQQERQALATLQHPHIAQLLDGGTENGLPFLVMECVEGTPIDTYCDEHRMTVEQRLVLFRTVCAAVHHAHQRLVIHRDIKPGNILVTGDGVPKLLDFGIAKILNETPADTSRTQTGVRFLSLHYASPEQIQGNAITTATDVYSLGVLLCVLLTGSLPYLTSASLPHELTRAICEDDVQRPSLLLSESTTGERGERIAINRGTTVEKLQRRLRGDLDTIILKALQKDPSRRYSSAEQLGEDIRRHLNGLPIVAAKDSFGYRASKFMQRHRAAVISASAFVLLLLASIVLISWQAKVALSERDRARLEAAKAEQVIKFLQETLSAANPYVSGKEPSVRDVLEKAAQRLENESFGQAEVQATGHYTIGLAYIGLGALEKAEVHLGEALALRQHLAEGGGTDLAASVQAIALLRSYQGNYAASDSLFRKALSLYHSSPEIKKTSLSEALNNYGTLFLETGRYDSAIVLFNDALLLAREGYGAEHPEVATVLNNIGLAYHYKVDRANAERYYRDALAMRLRLHGEDHPHVANSYNNVAYILMEEKKYADAEALFARALALRRKLLGEHHPEVAAVLHNLALNAKRATKLSEAEAYARESVTLWRTTVGPHHPDLARGLTQLGSILTEKKNLGEAERLLRDALHIRQRTLPSGHYLTSVTEGELALCLLLQHREVEAESLLVRSSRNLVSVLGDRAEETRRVMEIQHRLSVRESRR